MNFEFSEEQNFFRDSMAGVLAQVLSQEKIYQLVDHKKFDLENFFKNINQLGLSQYFAETPETALLDLLIIAEEQGRFLSPLAISARLAASLYQQDLDWQTTALVSDKFSVLEKKAKTLSGRILVDQDIKQVLLQEGSELQLLEITKSETLDHIDLASLKKVASEFKLNKTFKLTYKIKAANLLSLLKIAEAIGACKFCFKLTNEYVLDRSQFSVPVGSFQAIQHKLADTALMLESLSALLLYTAHQIAGQEKQIDLALNSLNVLAYDKAPKIIENCIQCHGGIGFTWEYRLHLYLRRVQALVSSIDPGKISEDIIRSVI